MQVLAQIAECSRVVRIVIAGPDLKAKQAGDMKLVERALGTCRVDLAQIHFPAIVAFDCCRLPDCPMRRVALKAIFALFMLDRAERPDWDRFILILSTGVTIGLVALYVYGKSTSRW